MRREAARLYLIQKAHPKVGASGKNDLPKKGGWWQTMGDRLVLFSCGGVKDALSTVSLVNRYLQPKVSKRSQGGLRNS